MGETLKLRFKIQGYQTDAVERTARVFVGQPNESLAAYRRDIGRRPATLLDDEDSVGYRNAEVRLNDRELLGNIRAVQAEGNIPQSPTLCKGLGACMLDIEMETGTGKTYVYIKTMLELNKRYGWMKFIVVVPSVAIREGVKKSFGTLDDHFYETYGKHIRYFVYDSANLHEIDQYSSSADLYVMIVNSQAFARDMKEGANNKASLSMYTARDDFQSRRPIDVLAANRPILILDEPQKLEGAVTQRALRNFKPLFVMNYSATHKTAHNCVYALDALDAYKQRLVKKIWVKGGTIHNLSGTDAYIYADEIIVGEELKVRLEIEVREKSKTSRKMKMFVKGDSLKVASKEIPAYEGFEIEEINKNNNTVTFSNGQIIRVGDAIGDVSEKSRQRLQVRETLKSHFRKERKLWKLGIKTLSLFFVDEVSRYKKYDDEGNVVKGELWEMFEEEYEKCYNENRELFDEDYQKWLDGFKVGEVHNGYFSIDKKGHAVNGDQRNGESTDVSAYDLILKDKERLLSFDEPTRFIFSHSALREGWDNPNVFQICMLRHSESTTARRQEVGRGLRLCVRKDGVRMDAETLGEQAVHEVNELTVIANESFSSFAEALQKENNAALRERPMVANEHYFEGKIIHTAEGDREISHREADAIMLYLRENDHIDDKGTLLPNYREAADGGTLAPMGETLSPIGAAVQGLIQGLYDPTAIEDMISDGNAQAIVENSLNKENADKAAFKALWNEINRKYVYTVDYDSEELIEKAGEILNAKLYVAEMSYTVVEGSQGEGLDFTGKQTTRTEMLDWTSGSNVRYDLVGEIARSAKLTRRTASRILRQMEPRKLGYFKNNPEAFIRNVGELIKEAKATIIVEHISYNPTGDVYEMEIFTQEKGRLPAGRSEKVKKHILDYVCWDSKGERDFVENLEQAEEVNVYAKLPRGFQIPTPVDGYAPDWAIAFNDGMGVKHVFFIAETKGSMDSMQLRGVEKAKIACASKLFNEMSTSKVRYHEVKDFKTLMDLVKSGE